MSRYAYTIAIALLSVILAGTHWKAYVSGRNAVRAEYAAAAVKASEEARAKEHALQSSVERLANDLQKQKAANAALSRTHADRLRQYEAAIGDARGDTATPSGDSGPFAAIAGECGRALIALDEHARGLAATARALQEYAAEMRMTTQQTPIR